VPPGFPPGFFARLDEAPDAAFYAEPRFVVHIDEATIAALTAWYAEVLAPGADVLDLMSSWVSHLPEPDRLPLGRVVGLGMNAKELAANPRLASFDVHDLNREPRLPYADASFDAALCAVSIQYLVRPLEVFAEVARVLRPGGRVAIATSHRCFPTKAIRRSAPSTCSRRPSGSRRSRATSSSPAASRRRRSSTARRQARTRSGS